MVHLEDGRYALIEFKLGSNEIDIGAKHLNTIENLIKKNLKDTHCPLRLPNFKILVQVQNTDIKEMMAFLLCQLDV